MQVIKLNVLDAGIEIPTMLNMSRISDLRTSHLGAIIVYRAHPKQVQYNYLGQVEDIPLEPNYVTGARIILPALLGTTETLIYIQFQVDDILSARTLVHVPTRTSLTCVSKRGRIERYIIPMTLDDIITAINTIQQSGGGDGAPRSVQLNNVQLEVGDNIIAHPTVIGKVASVNIFVGGTWQPWNFNFDGVVSEQTHVNLPSADSLLVNVFLIF